MKLKQKRLAKWAVVPAVLAGAAALVPGERRAFLHSTGELHPYYHFAIFFAMAFLAAWSTRSEGRRVLLCAAVASLGCLTEVVEFGVYHSSLEWTDMILDAMGAVAGMGLGALTRRAKKPKPAHATHTPAQHGNW